MSSNPYKGKICFTQNKKTTQKHLCFDVSKQVSLHFTDTLLCEFKNLQLSNEEKIKLTHKDRENIKKYQSVTSEVIQELADKFIKEISKQSCKKMHIQASDFGVYICLAAIFSGKLPKTTQLNFSLENTPLAIFPTKLLKKAPHTNVHYDLKVNQDSWLSPFKSLYDHFPASKITFALKAA